MSLPNMARKWLGQTWNNIFHLENRFLYAFGNTPAEDLLEEFDFEEEDLDILLLGCGDIRHLLKTVGDATNNTLREAKTLKHFRFHLNDVDDVVIARDICLLYLVDSLDATKPQDVAFLWAVWYNMELSAEHYRRLIDTLDTLCSEVVKKNRHPKSSFIFGNDSTKKRCLKIWHYWIKAAYDAVDIKKRKKEYIKRFTKQDTDEDMLSFLVGYQLNSSSFKLQLRLATDSERRKLEKVLTTELAMWYKTGSVEVGEGEHSEKQRTFINPTLMRPDYPQWHLHYHSNPFEPNISTGEDILQNGLSNSCYSVFQNIFTKYQMASSTSQVEVTFWCCDCVYLCQSEMPAEILFHLISTSNLADHMGLLPLLVSCSHRLKSAKAVLVTGTIRWQSANSGFTNIKDYLNAHLRCHPGLLPTLIGLHLAEDIEFGLRKRTQMGKRQVDLCWMKSDCKSSVIDIEKSTEIKAALQILLLIVFVQPGEFIGASDPTGKVLGTPAMVATIFERLQYHVKGGMKSLLRLLKEDDFIDNQKILPASWRAILAAYGNVYDRETSDKLLLLETPVPQHLFPAADGTSRIAYSSMSSRIVLSQMTGVLFLDVMSARVITTFRYRPEDNFVEILLLESDYRNLAMNTDVSFFTGIQSPPIPLGPISDFRIKTEYPVPILPRAPSTDEPLAKVTEIIEYPLAYVITVHVKSDNEVFHVKTLHEASQNVPNSKVSIKLQCAKWKSSFKLDILLSSYVETTEISLKKILNRRKLELDLPKSTTWNVGEILQPLSRVSLRNLQSISNEELLTKHHLEKLLAYMIKNTDVSEQTLEDRGADFLTTMLCIWHPDKDRELKHICSAKTPSSTLGSRNDIFLQPIKWYLYNGMPLLHLRYCGKISTWDTEPDIGTIERALSAVPKVTLIRTSEDGKRMLCRRLYINSRQLCPKNIRATKGEGYTFLQLTFPVTVDITSWVTVPADLKLSGKDLCEVCGIHPAKKCSACRNVAYCSQECQSKDWVNHKKNCIHSLNDSAHIKQIANTEKCHVCGVCPAKRCTACETVAYCTKRCQKSDWKAHKIQCQSAANRGPLDQLEALPKNDKSTQTTSPRVADKSTETENESGLTEDPDEEKNRFCESCGRRSRYLEGCDKCYKVFYCSSTCRKAHWLAHKPHCNL